MIAAELYKRTLAGYEALLNCGERISLREYCKTHHVNNRGLRYWMKQESIPAPDLKSVVPLCASCAGVNDKPISSSAGLVPLVIQPLTDSQKSIPVPVKTTLKDVNLTTVSGIVVGIKEISPADLAELILSCNIR